MALEIQVSRKQKIISRVIIVLLILSILAIHLLHFEHVRIKKEGDTTIYTSADSLIWAVQTGFLGFAAVIIGTFYGRQRHIFFKLAGVAIVLIGLFCLFNSPTGLNHQVVVTPDYFSQRIGTWYSPVNTKVEFKQIKYIEIGENNSGNDGLKYYLGFVLNTNDTELRININDLLKKAVPEIYSRAAKANILIGDGPDREQIPFGL